jgi:ABC-type amino acid transport substrate-binding protein
MDNNSHKKIKVGVLNDNYPFVTCDKERRGLIIEIWDKIVSKYNLTYELDCVTTENYDDAIKQLSQGKYDILLGDFSVIQRRWEIVNFSRPFYVAKIIIVRKSNNNIRDIFTDERIILLFSLSLVLILIYAIISTTFTKETIANAFYITFINFFTNMREIFPNTKSKYFSKINIKVLNVIWTILRYLFYTVVISQIISVFVSASDFIDENELKSIKEILVQKGTSFVDLTKKMGKTPIELDTKKIIVDRLEKSNKNEYWLHDMFTLNNSIDKYAPTMKISTMNRTLFYDENAIAVNKNQPELLDMINDVITELQDNGTMNKICRGYFDKEQDILGCSI